MSQLTALLAFLFLTASAAWATSTPQGQGAPVGTGREIADYYWWIIVAVVVVVVVAAAIWYFIRRNRTSV